MPRTTLLSPVQVAEILRVHQSTVKRWVDDGTIPATKTPGGHRKIILAELLRLVREKRLPSIQVDISILEKFASGADLAAEPMESIRFRFKEALNTNHPGRVHQFLLRCHQAGMRVEQMGDELIQPVMEEIGNAWKSGHTDVAQEHLGTSYVHGALVDLRNRLLPIDGVPRPLAIGACPEGDFYQLGNLLVEMLLLQNGWQVLNIGPNTPSASLELMMRKHRPRLVCLTCSHLQDPEKFVAEETKLHHLAMQMGAELFLGGMALTQDIRRRLHYHWIGETLTQFGHAAKRLITAPGQVVVEETPNSYQSGPA